MPTSPGRRHAGAPPSGTTDASPRTTATTVSGLSPALITYGALETLNLELGSAGDTFNIQSTHGGTTNLYANGGIDTINVGGLAPVTANAIAGALNIYGGAEADTLNVDDSGDTLADTATLTATTLDGLSPGLISYYGLETLNIMLGSAGDNFTIASTHGGVTNLWANGGSDTVNAQTVAGVTTIYGGADNDTINAGSAAPVTVNGIGAGLNVYGIRVFAGHGP